MFGLIQGIYENYVKKKDTKIILLGLENSGKTVFSPFLSVSQSSPFMFALIKHGLPQTFLEHARAQFLEKECMPPEKIKPTIGLNSFILYFIVLLHSLPPPLIGRSCHLLLVLKFYAFRNNIVLWDVGGQQGLRSVLSSYHFFLFSFFLFLFLFFSFLLVNSL